MIDSPCTKECVIKDDVCQNCFRTPKEIKLWGSSIFDAERRFILEKAEARKKDLKASS